MPNDNGRTPTQPGPDSRGETPAGMPAADSHFEEVHLLDYVKVLAKRRWTVGTVFVATVLVATVYAFTATPIFEARVRLHIEVDNPNILQFQQVLEERTALDDYYTTQHQLMASRSLARRTLDTLGLWEDPTFLGVAADDAFSVRRSLGDAVAWVGQSTGLLAAAPEAPDAWLGSDAETFAQSDAIDTFLNGFQSAPVRNSRLVDVTFRSPDPRLATRLINAHASSYIDQNLEFRFLASQDASEWLGEQLAEQRQLVEASEAALNAYRQQHDAISLVERQDIVVQRLAELNAAVTRAKTHLIGKEAEYRQLEAIQHDPAALDALPAIVSHAYIQEVRVELANLQTQRAEQAENLGDRHPDMIKIQSAIRVAEARLETEIAKVVQSVRNEFLMAEAEEESLARELDRQKVEALDMNEMGIGYGVLLREAESNRAIYDSLLQRANETGVSAELRSSNVRVVDEAEVPAGPVSPRRALILLIALLGGSMGGVGLAFFFEYLDDRIKTPEDLKEHLGLPSLGLVPAVPAKTLKTVHMPLINNGVPANFSEAFRTLRTSVVFSTADDKSTFVVTSTGPGEGKSVVTSNLGIGLAQAKQRVLVIDADMRRPSMHELFGLDQEPGLSNLLVGDAKSADVLRKTSVPGLWVLCAGKIPPNPSELLSSEKFKAFLDSLPEHFDWVLIDSPPVMAVTDASIVANAASGVIFVVGSDMTSRRTAKQALDQLEAANVWFVGGVLNRVDLERNPYYYSQYYRSQYQQYYTQDPQPVVPTRAANTTLQL